MKLTTEQQKQIEFAKTYKEKTGSFPKSMQWNMRDVAFELDNGETLLLLKSYELVAKKKCALKILRLQLFVGFGKEQRETDIHKKT